MSDREQRETRDRNINDLNEIIHLDKERLKKAVDAGDRVISHAIVDTIINNQRDLADLKATEI